MTRTILVAGTASHVGKSTVCAGLCRLLADRGVSVAPYKAQNMSNNARAVATPEGEFGEIGVSQYAQSKAARVPVTTDTNPVLLKPRGAGESQLVIQGEAIGHFSAGAYYDEHWERARATARESFKRLTAAHEVVIAEGAGSIAEINLQDRDLANVETAQFADAEILLVVDIERGGAFASLYGTIELLPADLRGRLRGALITKFRGDRDLLEPGIEEIEAHTGVPILGVLPYDDPGLPEEDSVSLSPNGHRAVFGTNDGVPADRTITIAVPRLPHISNFTDLEPLARERGVRVAYVPLDASLAGDVAGAVGRDGGAGTPAATGVAGGRGATDTDGVDGSDARIDAVVVPGTKNTVDDLLALRDAGFDERLRSFPGPIVGLCGGYQMLGERLTNAAVESTGDPNTVDGVGLLPVRTRFHGDKRVAPVTRDFRGCGPLAGASGSVTGYVIHTGRTALLGDVERPFANEGAATDRVLGTYFHGLFENRLVREAFLERVFDNARLDRPTGREGRSPYERAAALVREHTDLDALGL